MAIQGIVTNDGLTKTIAASNNRGWVISPDGFAVASTTGSLSASRTLASMRPTWYSGAISNYSIVGTSELMFECVIPVNAVATTTAISEIYLTATDSAGAKFLLYIGQPTVTTSYDPTGSVTLRIHVFIGNVDVAGNYTINITQAQEILGHENSIAFHQKNNFTATVSPSASDDGSLGYSIGSKWVDRALDEGFICVNNTTGAAKWLPIGGGLTIQQATLPIDTNLQTWITTYPATGVYYLETTTIQNLVLPVGVWVVDYRTSTDSAGVVHDLLVCTNIDGTTKYIDSATNGTWSGWTSYSGGGGGTSSISYFTAVSDGIKAIYSVADWVEPQFFYKTGANAIEVWFDGVYQHSVFTETNSTTITLNTIPLAGVAILCKVVSSYLTSGSKITEYRFIGDGVKTVFTNLDMNVTGFAYTVGNHELLIDIGSAMQNVADYTETTSSSVTFAVAPPSGVVGVIRVIGSVQLADAVSLSQRDIVGGYASFSRARRYSFGA